MIFEKFAGYAKDKKVFGKIVEFSMIKNEFTLQDEDGNYHKSKDVVVLEKIGVMNGVELYSGDVIKDENFQFELELLEDGSVRCYEVDDNYNRTGKFVNATKEKVLNSGMELIGNVYELRDKLAKTDFDFKVVKLHSDTKDTYYYALNNKDKKEIDLIKAIFLGVKPLNNSKYERKTITYDEYVDLVSDGVLKEDGEQEFTDYVFRILFEGKNLNEKLQELVAKQLNEKTQKTVTESNGKQFEKDEFEDFDDYEVDDCDVDDWEDEWDLKEEW